jgi:hypothetical protein
LRCFSTFGGNTKRHTSRKQTESPSLVVVDDAGKQHKNHNQINQTHQKTGTVISLTCDVTGERDVAIALLLPLLTWHKVQHSVAQRGAHVAAAKRLSPKHSKVPSKDGNIFINATAKPRAKIRTSDARNRHSASTLLLLLLSSVAEIRIS